METKYVIRLGNGWYDFKHIPQGYVKIHGLNCGSDEKALARANKINSNFNYELVDVDPEDIPL